MRQKLTDEIQTRKQVDHTIVKFAQTKQIVYFPPTHVAIELERHGVIVTRQYITRRYGELGIRFINGLWVKNIEEEDQA